MNSNTPHFYCSQETYGYLCATHQFPYEGGCVVHQERALPRGLLLRIDQDESARLTVWEFPEAKYDGLE